jgi:hypothetical protein
MNERIRELMVRADYPAPEIAKRAHVLAELIVRECARLIDAEEIQSSGSMLKEHFGVEE